MDGPAAGDRRGDVSCRGAGVLRLTVTLARSLRRGPLVEGTSPCRVYGSPTGPAWTRVLRRPEPVPPRGCVRTVRHPYVPRPTSPGPSHRRRGVLGDFRPPRSGQPGRRGLSSEGCPTTLPRQVTGRARPLAPRRYLCHPVRGLPAPVGAVMSRMTSARGPWCRVRKAAPDEAGRCRGIGPLSRGRFATVRRPRRVPLHAVPRCRGDLGGRGVRSGAVRRVPVTGLGGEVRRGDRTRELPDTSRTTRSSRGPWARSGRRPIRSPGPSSGLRTTSATTRWGS